MKFEWDPEKNRENIRKHGIDFADVISAFSDALLVNSDDRQDYGELRLIGYGILHNRIVAVVFTERTENTIRLISARKATPYEQKRYSEFFTD